MTQGCLGLVGPPCVTSNLKGTSWSKIEAPMPSISLHSGQRKGGREDEEQQVNVSRLVRKLSEASLGGFPGGAVVENPPANAGDTGLIPGPGRFRMPRSN